MRKVTESDVQKIIQLEQEMRAIRFIPNRRKAFAESVQKLSESETWLLTFCMWFTMFNGRFTAIDPDRICFLEPAKEDTSSFDLFIALIRRFKGVRISPSRDVVLVKFFSKCDRDHRDFYASLMTKQLAKSFPMWEVQLYLDLDSISSEKVYGELEYLKTGLDQLSYPVAVRKVEGVKLKPFFLIKEANYVTFMTKGEEGYKVNLHKPTELDYDLKMSVIPRFTLKGLRGPNGYYPIDYFSQGDRGLTFLNKPEPFEERISNLGLFLENSMLVHIDDSPVVLANNLDEFEDALVKVAQDAEVSELLITDSQSSITDETYRVTCRLASGVIEDVWISEGRAIGFRIWFNGELTGCSYKFKGKEEALLFHPHLVKDKLLNFYYITIKDKEYFVGKEVKWKVKRWRESRLRESGAWSEKCALCGSTRHKNANRGVCYSCECNLHHYYNTYGIDSWIEPSPQMRRKRYRAGWKYTLLNLVKYRYKGTILEANENGEWRFKTEGSGS